MNKIVIFILVFILLAGGVVIVHKSSKKSSMSVVQNQTQQDTQLAQQPSPTALSKQTLVPEQPVNQISLTISAPIDGMLIQTPTVVVSGKTTPNAQVVVDEVETVADGSGNFSTTVNLDEGENNIIVVANDANGNYAEQDIKVTYTSGQ